MEALKFKQLPDVIAELKNEVQEMKTLLLQKEEPQPEAENLTNNVAQLKAFVNKSKYIGVKEQSIICQKFGLPYLKRIFQNEYRNRFFEYVQLSTTTVATVSKSTEIPHKYLCQCKAYYENRGLLKVVAFGTCPTTGSSNVQFVTTNTSLFNGYVHTLQSNQLTLF
jgi:hypothetical protein